MLEYSNERDKLVVRPDFDMTVYELQAEISKTMANPLRLAILHSLKNGEKTVNELVEAIGASQSNISQHLSHMRNRQIVKARKVGLNVFYSVSNPKIGQACDLVREVLMEQLAMKNEIAKTIKNEVL
jgi:ArsR family transcriptional regulator